MINNSGANIAESIIIVKIANTIDLFDTVKLTKKRKSVKITDTDKFKGVEVFLDIDYGIVIPQTVKILQQAIASVLKNDLDIVLDSIDVTVEGVNIDNLEKR